MSKISFPEFNSLYNPNDESVYVPLHNKVPKYQGPLRTMTFKEIADEAKADPLLVIGWLVPKGTLVIDIDDPKEANLVLNVIEQRNEQVMVVKTTRGIHIYCQSDYNKKTTSNILACGAFADTVPNVKGQTFIVTPFKLRNNVSPILQYREVLHHNGMGPLPFWLTPLFGSSKKPDDAIIKLPLDSNRNDSLNRHLWRLKSSSLTSPQRDETIRIINTYLSKSPLTEDELNATVLRSGNNQDMIQKEFFGPKGDFLHHKMGDYLIKACNIKRCAISKQLYYYDEDRNIYVSSEDYLIGVMTRLCPALKDFQKREVFKYIDSYLVMDACRFNTNPLNIVFKNGILDVETMTLRPMTPAQLETIQLDVNYNPSAKSDIADEFFDTATGGQKDVEQLLYESIGYSMLKTNELQKAFILTGSGRNGKSTFLDLIKAILGKDNTTTVSFKDLAGNFRTSMLDSKLASIAGDISNQPLTDSDMVKSIIAGEAITMEKKYKDAFEAEVFATLFFAANTLPRTPDTTHGFYRRFNIIPFNANLGAVSRVEGMMFKRKLLGQQSLEYVAFKAVQAIHNVLMTTEEFTEPQCVKDMMNKYRIENSSVLSWFHSTYKGNASSLTGFTMKELYVKYSVWADASGHKPVRSTRFEDELTNETKIQISEVTNKVL